MAKAVAQFSITRTGEDFLISIEDEDGDTTEFTADEDMLDEIGDALEEALEGDDDVLDGVEDEEEEGEEEA